MAHRTEVSTLVARAAQEMLAYQAYHDPLTGLPNRALLMDRLEHALDRATRHRHSVAVLFLGIDRLKVVNDSMGHEAGDALLLAVARRLEASVRPEDTVARLGGDEFVILLDRARIAADAIRVAQRVMRSLEAPVQVTGRFVRTGVSVGIALGIGGKNTAAGVLHDADMAMYRAKQSAVARYVVHDAGMATGASERLQLEWDLSHAIERDELRLHYQPQVELDTGRIVRAEALLRWEHPRLGPMAPDDFIPIAEETGLIVPIGRWVIERAYAQARAWRDEFPSDPPVSISTNPSVPELRRPEIADEIARVLTDTGLDPRGMQLEITERALVDDTDATMDILRRIRGLGIGLSIDEFGTGYSSFSYLKRLPIDVIKLDRSFVSGLGDSPRDAAVVRAMIALARTLDAEMQAEGVETERQAVQLRELGCDLAQGYLFARPLPAAEMATLLAGGTPYRTMVR